MRIGVLMMTGALLLSGCAPSSQAGREPNNAEAEPAQGEGEQGAGGAQAPMMGGGQGPMMDHGGMRGACPTIVEGTTVRAEDVEGGAALVFTTTGDVTDLRSRVALMAEMHNQHPNDRRPRGGRGMRGWLGPLGADARAEDVEGGARVVFTPNDPGQLSALREQVRRHADWMASGQCPGWDDR